MRRFLAGPSSAPLEAALIASALAALAFAGCSRAGTGAAPDAGPVAFVGRSCNVDAECGSLRCDTVRHQCICLSDESCRSGNPNDPPRYCNNYTGLCVDHIVGCTRDEDCVNGANQVDPLLFCDASTRRCRPRKTFCEPCGNDAECGGAGDKCVRDESVDAMFCATACQVNADCPRGAACVASGSDKLCFPAPNPLKPDEPVSCRSFRGCTPDSLRSCNSNEDCAGLGNQRCDPSQGKCVSIDRACPFGTVCDPRARICVAECSSDADCGDPTRLRCVNRYCDPVGSCESDADCPANKVCSKAPNSTMGECLPFCYQDTDCPLGSICQRSEDGRYRCAPGCTNHQSCPLDQRCNPTTKRCEGPQVGQARICQTTQVCQPCERCDLARRECVSAGEEFPHCLPCSTSGDCGGGACVQMLDAQTYCARLCAQGQDCPQGFVCLPVGDGSQSACVPSDRSCNGKCL